EPHPARILVSSQPGFDKVSQVLWRCFLTRPENNRGSDLLTQRIVREPNNRSLQHRRVLIEHLFHLAGVDIETPSYDELLLAVDDVVIAVVVDPAHVAGLEPAAGKRGLCLCGPLPVTLHDVVAAYGDLAHLAGGHLTSAVIHETEIDALNRGADGTRLAFSVRVVKRRHR